MKDNVKPNPWMAWEEAQLRKIEEAKKAAYSEFHKWDWLLAINELFKLRLSLTELERKFVNRLKKYPENQLLTRDEMKYLARTYHTHRKEYVTHEDRCPACSGHVKIE